MNTKLPFYIAIPFYLAVVVCSILGAVGYSVIIVLALLAFYIKIIKTVTVAAKNLLLKKRIK